MAITAKLVSELRAKTGAGIMDCKKALVESDGDMTKAIEYLQKKSLAAVAKRAGKIAAEGAVYSYIHDGRVGAMVEVNSETDFVARGDDFQAMIKNIAMHIAASNPTYLDSSEIPAEVTDKQKEIYAAQLLAEGKPEAMIERIMVGKLKKWHRDVCLLDQDYVKDDKLSVQEYVTEVASMIKENIKVRRFVRFELGEGIEKKEEDFAAEVAAAASGV
jgi:elongation factor Ts